MNTIKKFFTPFALGLLLIGCGAETETEEETVKEESTDIVIVGAGLSGTMAALELEKNHGDVDFIVLEQMPNMGGALSATGGAIFATDSEWHKEQEKTSTVEDVVNYFEESSQTELNEDLIKNVFSISGETFDIVEEIVPFAPELTAATPHSDKLFSAWAKDRGMGFYEALSAHVDTLDMDLRYKSTVTELIVNDNEVTGVIVKDGETDEEYEITAENIVLATGGFGNSEELMEELAPNYADGVITVAPGATGDGIEFTREFGTEIIGDGTMGTFYAESGKPISSVPFMVNKDAERFVNESDLSYRIQRVLADDADGEMFLITDSNIENIEDIKADVEEGIYKEYATLDELAEDLNLDATVLQEEIDNYNEAVENNTSPGYDLAPEDAHIIKEAPFYAGHAVVRTFGTIPGIEVNADMQVLNGSKEPIMNLYGVGELTVGNAFSYQYPAAGIGISYACNSGRLAAINAVKTIK